MAARAYSYASKEWVEIRAVDPETGKQEWWDGFVSSTVEGHVRAHFKGNSPSLDLSVRVDSPRIRPARDPSIMEDDDDDEDRRADATPEAVYWSDFRQAAKEMEDKQTPLKRPPAPKSKNGHVVDTFVEKVAPPALAAVAVFLGEPLLAWFVLKEAGESPRCLGDALAPSAPFAPTWRPTCGEVYASSCFWASLGRPVSCLNCRSPAFPAGWA